MAAAEDAEQFDIEEMPLPRSPLLLNRACSGLLVIDMQQRLLPVIENYPRIRWNVRRLLDAAQLWNIPRWGTQQYPRGLGPTDPELAERIERMEDKLSFSCGGCVALVQDIRARRLDQLLVVGIETHVCVQQTVMDLMTEGYQVYVAADAVGARSTIDHDTALRRMEGAGATITTTEAAMFEWCETAGTDEFRRTSQLVRESAP